MFHRLLYKYNMISIALYRKNVTQKFYYVYINPKETTLIRDTDMIFVLSSTENIINIYEKNFEGKLFSNYDNSSKEQKNNSDNPNVFQTLIKNVLEQINNKENTENNNNNNKEDSSNKVELKKKSSIINILKYNKNKNNKNNKNKISINIKENHGGKNNNIKDIKDIKDTKDTKANPIIKGKFIEIDKIQDKLDKGINTLKLINNKYKDVKNNVDIFVKEEITNEILVYISKYYKKK